jgi:hypothetical protein
VWKYNNFVLFTTETTEQVESRLTNSLKPPGFKPCTWNVISWFQAFAGKCNLCRYASDLGQGAYQAAMSADRNHINAAAPLPADLNKRYNVGMYKL